MDQQRRCLTGMAAGLPIAVPASPATVVVHTLDVGGTNDPNARPALDVVTLVVANLDDGDVAQIQVTVNGTPIAFALVPAGGIVRIFDETPLGGVLSAAGGGGAQIALSRAGQSSGTTAWGWFVRTGG